MAAAGKLPVLVKESDIQGAFHVHTSHSDGSATLGQMAAAAQEKGWRYIGISDHSRSAVYAHGLALETLLEQRLAIDRLNADSKGIIILRK